MSTQYLYCPDCEDVRPIGDFTFNAARPSGRAPYCRVHAAERQREWKAAHADKVRAWKQDYLKRKRDPPDLPLK